jgi:serine/threonine protein kinase
MPPEQASGDVDVDPRADVYSLGAMLFLLLTGAPPAEEGAAAAMTRRRDLPKPLRAVCAKALHQEPSGRYDNVRALSADVTRYLQGDAVSAYSETVIERAMRVARTYRTAILLVLGYILMRAAVALIAGW